MRGTAHRGADSGEREVRDSEEMGMGSGSGRGWDGRVEGAWENMAESERDVVESIDIESGNGGRMRAAVNRVRDSSQEGRVCREGRGISFTKEGTAVNSMTAI